MKINEPKFLKIGAIYTYPNNITNENFVGKYIGLDPYHLRNGIEMHMFVSVEDEWVSEGFSKIPKNIKRCFK